MTSGLPIRMMIALGLVAAPVACKKKSSSSDTAEAPPEETGAVVIPTPDPTPLPEVQLYEPQNLPKQFSVAMPGALMIDQAAAALHFDEDDAIDPEEVPAAEEPDESSSHGLA